MKKFSLSELVKHSKKIRNENKSLGLVVGSFDVVHLGHLNLFRLAKEFDVAFILDESERIANSGEIIDRLGL